MYTADDDRNWPLNQWLQLAGIARPTYYTLNAKDKPYTRHIGRKVVVVESPRAWAERVGTAESGA